MIKITWLGHGTFQFQLPFRTKCFSWTPGSKAIRRILRDTRSRGWMRSAISHGHFDHIHDAVPLAKQFSPEVVGIYEIGHWLESKGVENTLGMNKGGTADLGS